MDDAKLEELGSMWNIRLPIQSDLKKTKDEANRNLMKFKKCKILHLGNHMILHRPC